MRLLSSLWALALLLAGPAAPQSTNWLTFENGGETHAFAAGGDWTYIDATSETLILILATHPDGTRLRLDFTHARGRTGDVLFRFNEPDTPGQLGREWVEGPGFGVTLSALRAEGETLFVAGNYAGMIVDPHRPGARARVQGSFDMALQQPVYSPN